MTAKAAVITGDLLKRKAAERPDVGLSVVGRSKKVGVRLDNDRYVRLKTFAAQTRHDRGGGLDGRLGRLFEGHRYRVVNWELSGVGEGPHCD